jgi:tubulin-folding cofactor B
MAALTMRSLLEYVQAKDEDPYANIAEGMVSITLTHNLLQRKMIEIRLDLHITIGSLKVKIYKHTGTPPQHQTLVLKQDGKPIAELDDDSRPLGFYSCKNGMEIKCVDTNPFSLAKNGGLEDVSQVKKYMMTDDEYDQRKDSVRQYKRDKLAEDPNWKPPKLPGANLANQINRKVARELKGQQPKLPPGSAADVADMKVGDRCELFPGKRRGTVKFVGEVTWVPGYWVGVEMDEPMGKHNGKGPDGKQYFECMDKCGVFKNPAHVTVGDFPEEDLDFSDSEEEL